MFNNLDTLYLLMKDRERELKNRLGKFWIKDIRCKDTMKAKDYQRFMTAYKRWEDAEKELSDILDRCTLNK